MITYAKEDYHLVYTTKLISIASGVCVFVYFLIFALPFLLVYATNGLWLKVIPEMHQLKITLHDQYLVSVLRNQTEVFSNIQSFEQSNITNYLPEASISSSTNDQNSDGVIDEIAVDIRFSVVVALFVDTEITSLNFKARSLLFFDTQSDLGISNAYFYGTTKFLQDTFISSSQFMSVLYDYDIFKANSYDMMSVFKDYYQRNYKLLSEYEVQKIPGNDLSETNIQIKLNLSHQELILKKPTFFAIIKFFWLQYFPVFIPVLIFGQSLLRFIYRFRFVNSSISNNLPHKYKDY